MPTIEMIILLLFIGATTGSITALISIAPTLIAIPALYLFLPIFGYSLNEFMLTAVATCITAFIPTHLFAWIHSMKQGAVDSQHLIRFSPGIAMGGVIGAQLLSLISFDVFKICFSTLVVITIIGMMFRSSLSKSKNLAIHKSTALPIGLIIGTSSVISGHCGSVLAYGLEKFNKTDTRLSTGTINGFAVFTSIAALIGFVFPAKASEIVELSGFAGAIHIPSMLILGLSHFAFYLLCRDRGNALDKKVLSIGFIVFLACSLVRLWIA
ncbi:MAG: sulfite exporter TauE/SafE family protein [Marinomonas foliarum]|jgi:uncharacterized protein|uniref:Probable membrane transporter protein n=1 Tax=Marinomonas foliarum TaxID=491950 RepID=A0A368ZKF8_9GAMM|nr:sulfite exporter TauE/SafE family protein [Marinomonas foliarum]RCW94406.1 putative membrane protein YfcA [Marinomonas foliarum]